MKNKYNYLDLFSGIGGFAKGAHMAGMKFENHYFSEVEKYCCKLYKLRFPNSIELGDITKIDFEWLKIYSSLDNSVKKCYDYSNSDDWSKNMAGKLKKLTEQQVNESIKMYEKGMSLADIGGYFAVSKQAMWDLLRRRIKLRSNKRYGKENHFYRGGKKADDNAQNILEVAIRKGIIKRKTHCEVCNNTGTFRDGRTKIQAHHCNYNKPLDVLWLCQKCHHAWHKENNVIEKETKKEATWIITGGFP